jgi:3-deoxy-D-manno-octulosonic-acid transferase
MQLFLKIIYNIIALPLLWVYSKILLLANDKAKNREAFANSYLDVPTKRGKRVLIHAASMGEFEQVKYLVEILRHKEPSTEVIVSFFSPSGFINLKDKLYYDFKVYLPIDFHSRVKRFVKHLEPDIVLVVRYDLWLNFVSNLRKSNIPVHLINATYATNKSLGKKYIGVQFYKSILRNLTSIYCVNEYHKSKFEGLKLQIPIKIVPDTRYDRVISRVENANNNQLIEIPNEAQVLVVGSCWRLDVKLIAPAVKKLRERFKLLIIYVPHEVDSKTIADIKSHISDSYIYSELTGKQLLDKDLIVDKIGLLLDLYKLADIAYVGGAFGAGVHSVTEPAGYGVPIFCGNQYYKNSEDARALLKLKGLIPVGNSESLIVELAKLLENNMELSRIGVTNKEYIYSLSGSSEVIYNELIRNN